MGELRVRRKLIYAIVPSVMIVASFYYFILTPNKYTATTKLMPVMSGATESASGLIGAMMEGSGFAGLISSKMMSESQLYVELMKSAPVLDRVLSRNYTNVLDGQQGTLYDLWDISDKELARRELDSRTSITANAKTGIVSLSIETMCPKLSSDIANEYIKQLDLFKQSLDRDMAGEVNSFLQEQLTTQEKAVANAEKKQAEFLAENRNYMSGDDPGLKLEVERLERDVFFQRQVLLNLMQLKASSDMDREKEIPRLSVIERAEPPTVKSGPHRIKSIAAVTFASLAFIVGLIALQIAYQTRFSRSTQQEIEDSYRTVSKDVRYLANRISRPLKSRSASEV